MSENTTSSSRALVYILSGIVGAVSAAFVMLVFMIGIIQVQAANSAILNEHLKVWDAFHIENETREDACAKERQEIREMVYEIREKVNALIRK